MGIDSELRGENAQDPDALRVEDIGAFYVVINDRSRLWLARADDYYGSLESIVTEILAGEHDWWYCSDDDAQTIAYVYEDLCNRVHAICAGPDCEDVLRALECDEQIRQWLLEVFGFRLTIVKD